MTPAQLAKSGTEDGHQMAVFQWARMAQKHGFDAADDSNCYTQKGYAADAYGHENPIEVMRLLFSTPNGGKRDKITAGRLRATGTLRGYPDISLDAARGGSHGLRIELKRPATPTKPAGVVSKEQHACIAALNAEGYLAVVCVGWQAAVEVLKEYLSS
jgi:hypothetical protein